MPKSDELKEKLAQSDPEIQRYVEALEAENAKLHLRIAKLEVQNVSGDNRIKALEAEIKENKPNIHVNLGIGDRNA